MLKITEYLKSGLVVSVITAIGMGLIAEPVIAGGDNEEKDYERVVKVKCNKGQSVQRVLDRFENRTKPLVLIIKGHCLNEDEEIEVNRDNVTFIGDKTLNGHIPAHIIVNARGFNLFENMQLDSLTLEYASKGEISIEEGGTITIDDEIRLNNQSTLDMYIEESGSIHVGSMTLETQSLTSVQQQETGGNVVIGPVYLGLQSSLIAASATVGDISLNQDSHAVIEEGVIHGTVVCDSHSRVWGAVDDSKVLLDPNGMSCKAL